jgi:hypothetical protein
MKSLRTLRQSFRPAAGRFERYYQSVVRPGSGYPTADEARRDILARERVVNSAAGWLR